MRREIALLPAALLVGILFIIPASVAQEALDVDKLAEEFICMCGCNLLLSVCETQMSCEVAKEMKQKLSEMISQGMSKEEIMDEMVVLYGSRVLAVPPKSGFTLALWVYPVIAVAIGGAVIYALSKRRRSVKWYIDPDEVVELDEEAFAKLEEEEFRRWSEKNIAGRKYEQLFRERMEQIKKQKGQS